MINVLNREEQLVSDALNELDQARLVYSGDISTDDSDEDDTVIQGAGIAVLMPVKGLIKTVVGCLRKTKKLLKKPSPQYVLNQLNYTVCLNRFFLFRYQPTQLDPLADKLANVSNTVDDLVCSLYSPVNVSHVLTNANLLATKLNEIAITLTTIAGEEDQSWIDFLTTATQHNLQNLQTKVATV